MPLNSISIFFSIHTFPILTNGSSFISCDRMTYDIHYWSSFNRHCDKAEFYCRPFRLSCRGRPWLDARRKTNFNAFLTNVEGRAPCLLHVHLVRSPESRRNAADREKIKSRLTLIPLQRNPLYRFNNFLASSFIKSKLPKSSEDFCLKTSLLFFFGNTLFHSNVSELPRQISREVVPEQKDFSGWTLLCFCQCEIFSY